MSATVINEFADRIELIMPRRPQLKPFLMTLVAVLSGGALLWVSVQHRLLMNLVIGAGILAVALLGLLQMFYQRVVMDITAAGATFDYRWGLFRILRRYEGDQVRNFRASQASTGYSLAPALAFDYGARTVRFALGIKPDESDAVLALVRRRFPLLLSAATAATAARFSP